MIGVVAMVEFIQNMSSTELTAFGYSDLGIYSKDSNELKKLIMEATIKNKYDLILLKLNKSDDNLIFRAFKKNNHN